MGLKKFLGAKNGKEMPKNVQKTHFYAWNDILRGYKGTLFADFFSLSGGRPKQYISETIWSV